jgi:putative ABC transport system permease protein
VVDANYATAHKLRVGSAVTVASKKFTIVGIVTQPQAGSPPEVYVPLQRAQALAVDLATGKSMKSEVNTVYVTAASAADIGAVQKEIQHLLPQATVTSSSDLASEITGSAASAAKLAGALGRWLAVLVLIAAFAVASLLTMAAVARRVPEFGTLKALGWRSSRIVSQVLGESVGTGIVGGLAGVGLGFAGVAIIDKIAPKLSATVPSAAGGGGLQTQVAGPGGPGSVAGPAASHATIAVPMSASVTVGAIVLAVLLAVAGGLLAGSFGGWRAARLRPAAALTRVA